MSLGYGNNVFTESVISRVRESVDIVELVSGYVSLKKTGKNWVGLCPFHSEKTPSFSVNPDKQIFHCFGCGTGGDAFKFVELQEGLNFPEAVRRLADRGGITLPETRDRGQDKKSEDEKKTLLRVMAEAAEFFRSELEGPAGSSARAYLAKRGVSDPSVRDFGLGYSRPEWDSLLRHFRHKGCQPGLLEKAGLVVRRSEGEGHYDRFRGRIIFPITDLSGNVIAFGGRVMDDSLPKYLNSPETPLYSKSNVLFCMDKAKDAARKNDHFIIVEGYLDAIACHQYGVRNAVATLGTALTDGHLRMMRRFTKQVKLIFDPDPAGVKAALRSFDLLSGSGMNVKVVSLPGGDDPDTFLKKSGYESFSACLRQAEPLMEFILRQVVRGGAGASIDEKKAWEGEMLGFIAKLPSGIERDHYLKKTAEALDVNEATLRQDLAQRREGPKAFRERAGAAERPSQRPKAEEMLIHLMLRDTDIARRLAGQLLPEDFTDPLFRRLADRMFSVLAEGKTPDARSLAVEGDDEFNRLISHYAVLDAEYSDPEKTCSDCMDRIRQHSSDRRVKGLLAAIRDAESRGDHAKLRELQEQLVQTRRQRQDGVAGR